MRYRYNPRTGAVQVGALSGGKLTKRGFEIGGESGGAGVPFVAVGSYPPHLRRLTPAGKPGSFRCY